MDVYIRIAVKFRFLFRDLAKFDETYRVSVGAGISFVRVYDSVPADAHKLLDRNGVKVHVWA